MSEDGDFGVLLALAYVAFVTQRDRSLVEAGHPGFDRYFGFVLRAVEPGPLSLSALAERLEMTRPGALKIVGEITDAGYLTRMEDVSDGRVRAIALTPLGEEALAEARRVQADLEHRLVDQFGSHDLETTRAVLQAIVEENTGAIPRFLRSMS